MDEVATPESKAARPLWPLLALWLLIALVLWAMNADAFATLTLPDTDDSLRLLQVQDWIGGQGWFDLRQHRLDPPAGADIHWTRLVDLPLAAVIVALTPLVGMPAATAVALLGVPLLTLLAAILLMSAIGRRMVPQEGWLFAPAILLTAAPVIGMMTPLRIDHHGWQIVALLAAVLGLITADRIRGGIIAGTAVAASLVIGVELLPYLGGVALFAAIAWVVDADDAPRLRAFLWTAAGGAIAGWVAFVPSSTRWSAACDALSLAYLPSLVAGAVVLLSALSLPLRSPFQRATGAFAAAIAAALPLMGQARRCLTDPYFAVDPTARRLWLDGVSEALPLWQQTSDISVASLALPVIGLAGALWCVRTTRDDARRRWLLIAGLSLLAILLSLLSTRAAIPAQALAVPGATALLCAGRAWLNGRDAMLLRVFGTVALFLCATALGPRLLIDAALATPETPAEKAQETAAGNCRAPAVVAALDRLPRATMLTLIDQSPAILANSHHSSVAAPYHRNGRAIADTMTAWAGDDATARTIIRRHDATLIAICGSPAEADIYTRRNAKGLHARLARGQAPAWAHPVPLGRSPWHVWRVAE